MKCVQTCSSNFQTLDLQFFQRHKTGDLVARATNDLTAVRMMLGPGISNLLNGVIAISVTGIAMISIDPQLTLYSLTIMPIITVLFIFVGEHIHHRYRKVQDQFGEVSARAQENFTGIRAVKAYAQEAHELDAFNQVNREYVNRSISSRASILFCGQPCFLSRALPSQSCSGAAASTSSPEE